MSDDEIIRANHQEIRRLRAVVRELEDELQNNEMRLNLLDVYINRQCEMEGVHTTIEFLAQSGLSIDDIKSLGFDDESVIKEAVSAAKGNE